MTAWEVQFAGVISQQHRAEQEKDNFLSSSMLFHLCCSFLSSFRFCIFSLLYVARALLPCQKILVSFLSHHPTLLSMPILCSFTVSLVSASFGSCSIRLASLCYCFSPPLWIFFYLYHHAWVRQDLRVAR